MVKGSKKRVPMRQLPAPSMKASDYLRSSEVADLLGTTMTTLRKWDKNGKLKAFKHPISGFLLYRLKDISDLLEKLTDSVPKPKGK